MTSDHITDAMVEAALHVFLTDLSPSPLDRIRVALLAAERAAWQPIETAPHGEDEFLVLENGGYGCTVVKRMTDRTIRDAATHLYAADQATHWRPLPPAPEADNA